MSPPETFCFIFYVAADCTALYQSLKLDSDAEGFIRETGVRHLKEMASSDVKLPKK